MNPFDRGLLIVFGLLGIIGAAFAVAILSGFVWLGTMWAAVVKMPGFYETGYALLAIYILIGIRLVWYGFHPGKKHAIVQEGSLGKVRIALDAIESLVEKVSLEQRGIKDAKAGVEGLPKGIGIRVKVSVAPDVSLPQTSELLQNVIREKVLAVTGIEVHDIRISVDNIAAQKMRVE